MDLRTQQRFYECIEGIGDPQTNASFLAEQLERALKLIEILEKKLETRRSTLEDDRIHEQSMHDAFGVDDSYV